MKKIGHAGTLDPLATGLMIMLIGKATKVFSIPDKFRQELRWEFLLGVETDSQDADGEVVATREIPDFVNAETIKLEMDHLLGDQYQTPPMFSAKKIDGVPL